ncbi:ABC transporter permease [bacterium]|nr:ABC transporter permease [bacterium]
MSHFLSDTRALTTRWLIHMKRDSASMMLGLFQPLLWLFLFGGLMRGFVGQAGLAASFGNVDYLTFYTAGVLAFTMLTNAVMGGLPIVFDMEFGFIDKVLSSPVSRSSIVVSRFVYVTLYSLLQAFFVLACAFLMGARFQGGVEWPLVLLGIAGFGALLAAGMTALSLALAFAAPSHTLFFSVIAFLLTPFLFVSSAFVPLSKLPEGPIRFVATWNPLTHAIDPIRALMCGEQAVGGDPSYVFHCVSLAVFDLLAIALSVAVIKRRLD